MNSNVGTENSMEYTAKPKGKLRRKLLNPLVCSVIASCGIFGGISALFIGLVCVVVHSLLAGDKAFDSVGTVLLIAAIPMILIGSIFLDEIETNK
ncbi:MAG: hypothetical protein ABL952_06600 [Pyrinomonadaceae bacterium]